MQQYGNNKDYPCYTSCTQAGEKLLCADKCSSCQAKAADQDIQEAYHEGHAAYALAQRNRFQAPAKGVFDGGHLLFKLLDVELLNDIHTEEAPSVRLAQADDRDEEGDAYDGTNKQQSNY